jgi:ABC-2 type transport system ATP-binding protein
MSPQTLNPPSPAAPAQQRAARRAPAVELRNVSHWYGNVVAVNDVSFTLDGGITGLLGPNGAGKSTLLHMMAGFLAPSAGEVLVDGAPAWMNPQMYRSLGLVPEREAVYPFLTGYQFALMNARLHGLPDPEEAAERAMDTVDLRAAMHRRIGGYSKGMRQRAKIAGALVHEPGILLLDEPFNGMDPAQRMQMIELLRELATQGKTILISSHILEELHHLANNVLVVVAGRLAASGHFREIRRLMTDRPHTFILRSSDDRALAAALMADASVQGIELGATGMTVRTAERGGFARMLPLAARNAGVTLYELRATDESLESVFSYLVKR